MEYHLKEICKEEKKSGTSPSIAILLEGGKKKECLSNQIFVNCVTVTEFIFTIVGPTKWNKKEEKKGRAHSSQHYRRQTKRNAVSPPASASSSCWIIFSCPTHFFFRVTLGAKQIFPVETSVDAYQHIFFVFHGLSTGYSRGHGESYYRILFRISSLPSLYVPISSDEYRGYHPLL